MDSEDDDANIYSSEEEGADEVDDGKAIHHNLRESLEVNKENLETTTGFYEKTKEKTKSLNSSRDKTNPSTPSHEDEDCDAEDGEILEDGEINDEDGADNEDDHVDDDEKDEENSKLVSQELPISKSTEEETITKSQESDKSAASEEDGNKEKENSESESEDDETKDQRKRDRKKRKRQREKEKKKKMKEEGKRKRKKHGYVDYDKVEENFEFKTNSRKRSPPGAYDSPGYSPPPKRSPPGPYDSPYRSPPGPYDSPPESPPGPYDSPSEESGEEGRYGEQDSKKSSYKKSMMGMLDDAYLHPNIAVSEKQDLFREPNRGRTRKQRGNMMPRKKPLLETPRAARPLCKFYKEGKCAKGSQCPFNHDFTPPKKPDICKFYLSGNCNKGRDCIYMHEEYPCKFFHTGAKCYQGDSCKFSHEPLNDDTRILLDKILDNNDDILQQPQQKGPRPSLLGSPPRHVKEAAERMKTGMGKKIPSLFDIEVFPPKQSPKKQKSSGSNSDPLSPPSSQPGSHGRPGFYNETITPPVQPNYNPAVLALGALLNQAVNQHVSSSSLDPRHPSYQSPTYTGPDSQQSDSVPNRIGKAEVEPEDRQDTQKLEEESSQEDRDPGPAVQTDDPTSDEERQVAASFEIPSHLPPRQRELFMRIHLQQKEGAVQGHNQSDTEERVDDDDWYSSDEDETGTPKHKVPNMFSNLGPKVAQSAVTSQTVVTQSQSVPSLNDSGSGKATFDILQMLNAIRGQGSTLPTGLLGSTVQSDSAPQEAKAETKSNPRTASGKTPPRRESVNPMEHLPRVPKDGSELPYKVLPITVSKVSYIPPNLNLNEPSVRNDPRIQQYMSRGLSAAPKLERQASQPTADNESAASKPSKAADLQVSKSTTDPSTDGASGPSKPASVLSKPLDPRKARSSQSSESPSDPRRPSKESSTSSKNSSGEPAKTIDPRLQRAMTELLQSAVLKPDPRLQKVQSNPVLGMHSLPPRPPMGPRFGLGPPRPLGPRGMRPPLLRTPIMHDNSFRPNGPPPFHDPRMGRQNSMDSAAMNFGNPRMRPLGRSPNMDNPNFSPHSNEPRIRPQGMSPNRENMPGFGPAQNDPRVKPQGMSPSSEGSINIGLKPNDPRAKALAMAPGSEGSMNPSVKPNDPRRRPQEGNNPPLKCGDPRMGRRGSAVDTPAINDPRLTRQISQPAMSEKVSAEGENSSTNSSDDSKLNHRNDPRFKRKTVTDNSTGSGDQKPSSPPAKKKKFIGQRKGSMEYSSPLGMSSDQPDPTVTGFSSYNRPLPNRAQSTNSKGRSSEAVGSSGLAQGPPQGKVGGDTRASRPAGYSSPGYGSPSHTQPEHDSGTLHILSGLPDPLNPPQTAPGPPLKELFKTIDPTASPFC